MSYARRLAVLLSLILVPLPAFAHGPVDDPNIAFFEEWMTYWPIKGLGDALAWNEELGEHPDVDAAALRKAYQPVVDTFTQSMQAYFGPQNNAGVAAEGTGKFFDAHGRWRQATLDFIAYAESLPIGMGIAIAGNEVSFSKHVELVKLYAGVPFQTLVVVLHGEGGADDVPKYREEIIDLNLYRSILLETDGKGLTLIRLQVSHLPEGEGDYPITVLNEQGAVLGTLPLRLVGKPSAKLRVRITDGAGGSVTPARVGLYGNTGFLRPVNAVPLMVHETEEYERSLYDPMWPNENKRVFYSRGEYEMAVPPGDYRLMVRKGIERLLSDQRFAVAEGEDKEVLVPLERWVDMPAKGWYSGDDHIHVRRNGENNEPIMQWVKGEDIHVSNCVQMDDINTLSFLQYAWGDQGMYLEDDFILRSGQEGPRTNFRGHMLFYNLQHSIHDHDSYYIYEDAIDRAHEMGALAGYAHHGIAFGAELGMSVDVPLNKVDFLEVMESYGMNVEVLHHFWNLGFKLTPTAGSDYPYNPTAGDVLTYVYTSGEFSWDNWFAGLEAGHTFVTSSPMMEFTVEDKLPGDALELDAPKTVRIHAAASVNPTLDKLHSLEVLRFGKPIKTVTAEEGKALEADFDFEVNESAWLALRVNGAISRGHSNAVYITVAGAPFWDTSNLDAELARAENVLKQMEAGMSGPGADEVLKANASRLNHYIDAAREQYARIKVDAE